MYSPVCGTNNVTYEQQCAMDCRCGIYIDSLPLVRHEMVSPMRQIVLSLVVRQILFSPLVRQIVLSLSASEIVVSLRIVRHRVVISLSGSYRIVLPCQRR